MFDILGIMFFLLTVVSLIAIIMSIFNRRMNQKLWIIILITASVLLIGSYYLDMAFDKDEPIKIDYSGIKLDPTPTPKPTPTPTPVPTPTPMIIDKKTKVPVVSEKSEETPVSEIQSEQPVYIPEETEVPEQPSEETPSESDITVNEE